MLAVAQLPGVSDDGICRALDHYVAQAQAREDDSAVRRISFDGRMRTAGNATSRCSAMPTSAAFYLPRPVGTRRRSASLTKTWRPTAGCAGDH